MVFAFVILREERPKNPVFTVSTRDPSPTAQDDKRGFTSTY